MATPEKMRWEKDSLGSLEVPTTAYYGINVMRARANFPISRRTLHPRLVEAYCRIKKAAATVNLEAGRLAPEKAAAITGAADEVLAGKLRDQFVVDIFQAGAGTSTNMNVNEVLCNRALELLGFAKGDYHELHPNDHLNMSQSTNDTFPTAMHLAVVDALADFYPAVDQLAGEFKRLGQRFAKQIKSGRTHLQDAVPVTLGGEFRAYADSLKASMRHIRRTAEDLLTLAIGGSATGTGMNTHPDYAAKMAIELSKATGKPFLKAQNLMQAMQSQAPVGRTSGALRDFAGELGRIANDLRLLSSGPTTGLSEIILPPVQAGSSIMPGKVNPSIAEMVNMVCFHVIGNDTCISRAVGAGQLELNVMMPIMAENMLESIEILTSACTQFCKLCVAGIEVNRDRCLEYAEGSLGLVTALAPVIGYVRAAEMAKQALKEGRTIIEVIRSADLLDEEQLKKILDLKKLTGPDPNLPG